MGSELMSSGIAGPAQSDCSKRPSVRALMRVSRARPEPLTTTTPSASAPRRWCSHCDSSVRACSWRTSVAGAGSSAFAFHASVRNSCSAIVLLLNLLMSRTICASCGDSNVNASVASRGRTPSRTWPDNLPPSSRHSAPTSRRS